MKKILRYLFLLPFFYLIFAQSCANTSTPPSGGPKDTIPPVIIGVEPDSASTEFPLKGGKITIKFNEFVVLKEESKNIFLSPPLKKRVDAKIRAKSIVVTFPEQLDSGISYTLEFGKAINDNNEGNQFPPYYFPFSTGKVVDSMIVSGSIFNYQTLLPVENTIIAFYENLSDSAVYKELPSKIAKSDKWGYFSVKNLKPAPYKVYAYGDINDNYKFDPENEMVAFLDSIFIPKKVIKNDITELIYVHEKDTAGSLSRPSAINLYLFREPTVKQFIKNNGRPEQKKFFIKFASPNVKIDSIAIQDQKPIEFIKQYNSTKDSLVLWIRDTSLQLKDTVNMIVKYLKSDTTDILFLGYDTLQMVAPKPPKINDKERKRLNFGQSETKERKDLLEFEIIAQPDMVEQYGFSLNFKAPLIVLDKKLISMNSITPKGEKGNENFKIIKDDKDSCKYSAILLNPMKQGYEYELVIQKNAFIDIYKNRNDSIAKSVILPNDEKLSKINLQLKNVDYSYIVELTNLTRDKAFRTFKIDKDATLEFPYITPGSYSIRITRDENNNGIIDTGSLAEKRQPEKVRLYSMPGGGTVIKILESVELTQVVDLNQMFK